ncbi:MAG: spore maturation protein A [Oscillospiraceae bacterium]|nr:spore maturation protein A [Oscillospiraceae bacterium]
MVMSWIFTGMVAVALIFSIVLGNGEALASAVTQGAQSGVTLVISMAGAVCLWTGVAKVMEKAGIMNGLSWLLRPILHRLFPSTKSDSKLAGSLSANICANLLGLGNAATPMGIQAAQRLASKSNTGIAGNELCRLVVLNTASIQLIPTTVAAVRSSLGCVSPFDILPAVWVTSFCSASAGLLAAWCLGKLWRK